MTVLEEVDWRDIDDIEEFLKGATRTLVISARREEAQEMIKNRTSGPIHTWFSLTYASYLVLPRCVLQSKSVEWQDKFVKLLEEVGASHGGYLEGNYAVNLRGSDGRFKKDELAEYRHTPVLPHKALEW